MSTHNICFRGEIRKMLYGYPLLSVAMLQYVFLWRNKKNIMWLSHLIKGAIIYGTYCSKVYQCPFYKTSLLINVTAELSQHLNQSTIFALNNQTHVQNLIKSGFSYR